VIDYMLRERPEHTRVDSDRVGFFGFSMGGYTGLMLLGATPDFSRIRRFCARQPEDLACRILLEAKSYALDETQSWRDNSLSDNRIKAAVLAAPGFPYAFGADSLSRIRVPVQLWSAGRDDRVPGEDVSELSRLLPIPPEYHSVQRAGHFAFLPPCNISRELCTDAPDFDRAEFHQVLNNSVVEFFMHRLSRP
jgi:predicted dienelactone hydrolase